MPFAEDGRPSLDDSAARARARRPAPATGARDHASVHADRLELVLPGVGDRRVLGIGQHDRRCRRRRAARTGADPGRIAGACGNSRCASSDMMRLHIGDRAVAQMSEFLRRSVPRFSRWRWSPCSPFRAVRATRPDAHAFSRAPKSKSSSPPVRAAAERRRSTAAHSQVPRRAPACPRRAGSCAGIAAPRCRDGYSRGSCRLAGVPGSSNWLSSCVTSISSRAKPATAKRDPQTLRRIVRSRRFARYYKGDSRPKPTSTPCRAPARSGRSRAETANSKPSRAP